jgi:anti-sigma B factor antagonist
MLRREGEDMEELTIGTRELGDGVLLLELEGFVDAHTFLDLERTISRLFAADRYKLALDVTRLGYLGSAGAGSLIHNLTIAREKGGDLILVGLRKNISIHDVLSLLGQVHHFTIVDTVQDVMAAFHQRP